MLSIYTPTHNPKHLEEVYESIKDQPFDEWVILCNGENADQVYESIDIDDERVHVMVYRALDFDYIGDIKAEAVKECSGDILVELDHDDLLSPYAIEKIKGVFNDFPDVGFVYSDFAEFDKNGKARAPYSHKKGWDTYDIKTEVVTGEVETYCAMSAFPPHPQSLGKIWYTPNHVRAFRRSAYEEAGGYDRTMQVLDDQDFICRMYQVTDFHHIPECLYFYRVDGENSYIKYNEAIQEGTWWVYDKYVYQLAETWADKNNLRKLDLGSRFHAREGFEVVDVVDTENVDVVTDLNEDWPFEDNSVGVIIAHDLLEHLDDKLHAIKEIYRVLAHGGVLLSMTPSTDGRGAFQDPTHVSFYNQNSFLYYTDQSLGRFIDTPVRFQEMRMYTGYLGDWQKKHDVSHVFAHLMAIKEETPKYGGEWKI